MSSTWLAAPLALQKSCVLLRDGPGYGMCELPTDEWAAVQTGSNKGLQPSRVHPHMSQLSDSNKNSSWMVTQHCSDLPHWPSLPVYLSVLHITFQFSLLLLLANLSLSPVSRRASLLSVFLPDFFCHIEASQDLNHIWKKSFFKYSFSFSSFCL